VFFLENLLILIIIIKEFSTIMQKKLITKLLVATILSMTISTGIAYAKTDTKNIDETNNKIVEEQQKSIINKEKQDIIKSL
jgi:hypothetical protein